MNDESQYDKHRRNMVRTIEDEVKFTREYIGREKLDQNVIAALNKVPRHKFVRAGNETVAYVNEPLYIGHGQTISQPYIVAIMTDLIAPKKNHIVLDIGTGSGYQAAILSHLVRQVYSVEIIGALAEQAIQRFKELAYDNIEVKVDDGVRGWIEYAPFDGIIVAAAASYIPTALVQQLKPGGKMIIPVGQPAFSQELVLVDKNEDGKINLSAIMPVSFVPLVSDSYMEEIQSDIN